jgi:hypothetical protein
MLPDRKYSFEDPATGISAHAPAYWSHSPAAYAHEADHPTDGQSQERQAELENMTSSLPTPS